MKRLWTCVVLFLLCHSSVTAESKRTPALTSLTNLRIKYSQPNTHYIVLKRGDLTAVIVDNHAVDNEILPKHRAGYNGVASLKNKQSAKNLFVPSYAGLNYEHIHDGTLAVNREKFEPRKNPMQLRIIDEYTVELYQAPTENWKLESCGRYRILPNNVIEYSFECIPRADTFQNGFIGLFWASYINAPEDKSIWFKGQKVNTADEVTWINGVTPRHGVSSTHPPAGKLPKLKFDPQFPLTLVNNRSEFVYRDPFYYGVCRKMAFVQTFRSADRIWFAQSPTGGGRNNPAWDFQWFIPNYRVNQAYGFVMRAHYFPYQSKDQIEKRMLESSKGLIKQP